MLKPFQYPEKWHLMSTIVSKYPAIDLARQYKYLVIKRLIAANVYTFLLQYIGLMISTLLPNPGPVWFATGAACATVFLRGYRVSTGIFLGGFTAYYLASHQLVLSFSCATIYVTQAGLLTWITRRYITPSLIFYHPRDLLKFSLCSGTLTALSSCMLIWFCREPYTLWLQWWFANWNAVLIVGIALVSTDSFFVFGDKLLDKHKRWYKTTRCTFMIALFIDMFFYLNLTLINMSAMIALQLLLLLGTLSSLFMSLKKK